ncbi:hypothetical protein HYH03_014658 [Edaphochlamys debaryana]|uniref:OTU domain-containing protein n=1 Tax=Edaphochlamys debaryana TaxID=47281 RepID=A0A836BS31_9CHLO|nr:hypothetical protein HYH03_014658 [Edaphochlamys debaryana]|eukprot:KAG2486732.1 hypothetical protein HYH03_014658 [Edaphochlamys debaryana]
MPGLCMRGSAVSVVESVQRTAPSADEELPLPTIPQDSTLRGRAADLHRQLSHLRPPLLVPRDQCTVNLDFGNLPGAVPSYLDTVDEATSPRQEEQGDATTSTAPTTSTANGLAAGTHRNRPTSASVAASASAAAATVAAASSALAALTRPNGGANGNGNGNGLFALSDANAPASALTTAAATEASSSAGGSLAQTQPTTGAHTPVSPGPVCSGSGGALAGLVGPGYSVRSSVAGSTWEGGAPSRRGFVRVKSIRSPHGLEWSHSRKCLEVLITAEREKKAVAGMAYKSHEQRLRERLERLNLDMLIVAGDGNCQFRSISNELYGTQDHHSAIRKQGVSHIVQQRSSFECFLGEDFDEYVRQMARGGTWGDELTLRATCDAFGIVMHVVTSDVDNWYLTYEPEVRKLDREIFLTYIAPIHYNSIRRQSSLKTMALTVSRSFRKLSSSGLSSRSASGQLSSPTVTSPGAVTLGVGGGVGSHAPSSGGGGLQWNGGGSGAFGGGASLLFPGSGGGVGGGGGGGEDDGTDALEAALAGGRANGARAQRQALAA